MIIYKTKKGIIKVNMEGRLPDIKQLNQLNKLTDGKFEIVQVDVPSLSTSGYSYLAHIAHKTITKMECPLNQIFII